MKFLGILLSDISLPLGIPLRDGALPLRISLWDGALSLGIPFRDGALPCKAGKIIISWTHYTTITNFDDGTNELVKMNE